MSLLDHTVTVKYVDESGKLLEGYEPLVTPVEYDGTYDVTTQVGKPGDTRTVGDGENKHNYIWERNDGEATGTVTGDVVINVVYTLDDIGTDPEDPNKPDGIPDKYQVLVHFVAKNGTFDGQTNVDVVLTKVDSQGNPAVDGTAKLEDKIPVATANTKDLYLCRKLL